MPTTTAGELGTDGSTEQVLLSVVVPTYNERQNVRTLVNRIERAVAGIPHELIFVDDSTDGTDRIIAELAQGHVGISLIHRQARGGLASAAIEGIRRAQGQILCVLDADLQHPPEVLPLLLEALQRLDADLVVASRYVAGGSYNAFSTMRRLTSRVATLLTRAVLSRARLVSDPLSGFFAFRKRVVQYVSLHPLGYKILLEILVRGQLARIAEVPYRFEVRGAGHSKLTIRQNWEFLHHLLRLVLWQPGNRQFFQFCVVGGSGIVINMSLLWALTAAGIYYMYSGITAVAGATTWNFLLNDAFTWGKVRSPSLRVKTRRYFFYWAVTGVGSAMQMGLLYLLTTAGLPYLISNVLGIGAAVLWNFQANRRWTWRSSGPPTIRMVYQGQTPDPGSAPVAGG